jgi:hypothetical protein
MRIKFVAVIALVLVGGMLSGCIIEPGGATDTTTTTTTATEARAPARVGRMMEQPPSIKSSSRLPFRGEPPWVRESRLDADTDHANGPPIHSGRSGRLPQKPVDEWVLLSPPERRSAMVRRHPRSNVEVMV